MHLCQVQYTVGDPPVSGDGEVHEQGPWPLQGSVRGSESPVDGRVNGGAHPCAMSRPAARLSHEDSDLACTAPCRRWWRTAGANVWGSLPPRSGWGQQEVRRRERWREHQSRRSSCPHVTRRPPMSHTLMSLDAGWRRLTRTSRAGRALKQWSIAHRDLRGPADLDALLAHRPRQTRLPPPSSAPWPCSPPAKSGRPHPAPGAAAGINPPGRLRRPGRDRGHQTARRRAGHRRPCRRHPRSDAPRARNHEDLGERNWWPPPPSVASSSDSGSTKRRRRPDTTPRLILTNPAQEVEPMSRPSPSAPALGQ